MGVKCNSPLWVAGKFLPGPTKFLPIMSAAHGPPWRNDHALHIDREAFPLPGREGIGLRSSIFKVNAAIKGQAEIAYRRDAEITRDGFNISDGLHPALPT